MVKSAREAVREKGIEVRGIKMLCPAVRYIIFPVFRRMAAGARQVMTAKAALNDKEYSCAFCSMETENESVANKCVSVSTI